MIRTNVFLSALMMVGLLLGGCSGDGRSADERVVQAQQYLNQDRNRDAIIEMRSLLQTSSDRADARLILSKALLALGDVDTAYKEASRARDLGASPNDYLETLARSLQGTGAHVDVIAEVDPGLIADAELASTLRAIRGSSMLALGSYDRAQEVFERVLEEKLSAEGQRIALLGMAELAVRRDDLAASETLILQALELLPGEADSLLALGRVYLKQRKYHETLELLGPARGAKAPEERQDTFFIEAQFTEALLGVNDLERARESVEVLKRLGEQHPMHLFLRGRLEYQVGNSAASIELFQQVLAEYPNYVPALTLMGVAMIEREDVDQAEMFLTRAVANDPGNVRARRLLAETRLRMGRNRAAMRALREGLSRDDEDAELLTMLGQATLRDGEGEEALKYLHAAYEKTPNSPNAGVVLASAYLSLGNAAEAIRVLKSIPSGAIDEGRRSVLIRVAGLDSSNARRAEQQIEALLADVDETDIYIPGLAGSFYAATGQVERARALFRRVLAVSPGNRSALLSLLSLDERDGDYTESRGLFEQAHAEDPDDLLPVMMLARIYASSGEHERAMALIGEANERDPTALLPNLMLAAEAIRTGDFTRADELSTVAVEHYPRSAQAFALNGIAKMNLGQLTEFKSAFERAVVLDPDNVMYNYYLGKAAWDGGQIIEARENFTKVVQGAEPFLPAMRSLAILQAEIGRTGPVDRLVNDIRTHFGESRAASVAVGEIRSVQRRFRPSETAFEAAQSIEPSWYVANKLFELRRAFDDEDPTRSLRQWGELHPQDGRPRQKIAQHYHSVNKIDEAIIAYEQTLEVEPDSVVAQNNLAWLYFERDQPGDQDRALTLAESAYEQSQRHPAIADTLGWLLFRRGDAERGRDILREAILATSPERSPDIAYHYATTLYERDGIDGTALELLQNALTSERPFSSRSDALALRNTIVEALERREAEAREQEEQQRDEEKRQLLDRRE